MDPAALGIRQRGDPILKTPAEPFLLPDETPAATLVWERLLELSRTLKAQHSFSKGVGIAAPQIGLSRCIALIHLPNSAPKCLINPSIISASPHTDCKFEGCLSFFGFRVLIARSLAITVEYQDLFGTCTQETFEKGAARLVAHEIDHLNGLLCDDRISRPEDLITYADYLARGQTEWNY